MRKSPKSPVPYYKLKREDHRNYEIKNPHFSNLTVGTDEKVALKYRDKNFLILLKLTYYAVYEKFNSLIRGS